MPGAFYLQIESKFDFDFEKNVEVIYQSLIPELEGPHHRTSSKMDAKGISLILKIRANDLVSMRAAMNGWLRLIRVADEMTRIIDN